MKQKTNFSDQIILLITQLAGAPRRFGANSVGNKLDQPFSCLDKNSFPIKSSSSHFPNDSHSFFFPQPTSLLNSYPSFFVSRPKRSLDRDNVRGSWLFILFPMPDICGDTFKTGNSIWQQEKRGKGWKCSHLASSMTQDDCRKCDFIGPCSDD